jgi:hypothetical protein
MATSFSGGRSRSTRREPLTMGKQLVSFITCGNDKGLKNYEMKVENLSNYLSITTCPNNVLYVNKLAICVYKTTERIKTLQNCNVYRVKVLQ